MTNRTSLAAALLLLMAGPTGCGDSQVPIAPTQNPPPVTVPPAVPPSLPALPPTLMVFTDSSGFSTSELRDVQDQIVQFNSANELIWAANDTRFQGFRVSKIEFGNSPFYMVSIPGTICPQGCAFEVRFGSKDGQRRAYLTVDYIHDNPGTLVDVEIVEGAVVVAQTTVFPPGTPTLSGIITELTPTGPVPLSEVNVWRGVTAGARITTSDKDGRYSIPGLIDATDALYVSKEGYQSQLHRLTVNGDTRFDVELVRRSAQ